MTKVSELNWATLGYVTSVKDQGYCGSCWAFTATGAIESHWKIKKGVLPNLSEQNLIDCSWQHGNQGCNGGLTHFAFDYILSNKGINDQQSYPYKGLADNCNFKSSNIASYISGYNDVITGDENSLEIVVRDYGPVSAAIEASYDFMFYAGGIFPSTACTSNLNHAVLIVGYNNTNIPPYWIAKNSWGVGWGESGYIRIEKSKNACGIANLALIPLIK